LLEIKKQTGWVNVVEVMTIIELENSEVEEILDAEFVFVEENVYENVVHTCVEGFKTKKNDEFMTADDAIEKLFLKLKVNKIIPNEIEDFSYELYSCERLIGLDATDELPKKIAISFTQTM